MSFIEADNFSVVIDGRSLLDCVSLEVAEGSVHALVGGRGAGKTLLLRALVGMWPSNAVVTGRLRVGDYILTDHTEEQRRMIRRTGFLYLPAAAKDSLNPIERISRQIADVCAVRPRWRNEGRGLLLQEARRVFRQLGIADPDRVLRALPDELSGGMNKRVLLAMAILVGAHVIAADEPTTGLDVTIQRQILDLLAQLQETQGFTLVMATQNLGIVAHYSTNVSVMAAGRVHETTTARQLFANPASKVGKQMVAYGRA